MAIGTPGDLGHNSTNNSTTSLVITTNNAVATGDLIVVFWGLTTGSNSVTAVTDSSSNTYHPITNFSGAVTDPCGAFYAFNATSMASSSSITCTINTTAQRVGVSAIHVTGIRTDGVSYDPRMAATTTGTAATSATSIVTPAMSSNSELLLGCLFTGATAVTGIASTGYTAVGGVTSVAVIQPMYHIITANGTDTFAPTWTTSTTYRSFLIGFLGTQASNTSRQTQQGLLGLGQ